MGYQEKFISASDGLKIYVRDYRPEKNDKGRPIVCLAGLTRNSQDFGVIAPLLQDKGHRVVTLDYRGRGQSERDDTWVNYNPRTYISDIFQVLAALNLHDCTFIGTSLGGLLSMAMCSVAPGLVHNVILNDVGPDLDENGIEQIIAYTGDSTAVASMKDAVQKLKSYYPSHKGYDDTDWERIAQRTYKLEDGQYVPNWDCKIADSLEIGSANEERKQLWPLFYSMSTRDVLVIRGAESSVFKEETYRKMLGELPNISGIELAGVGHAPTLEEERSLEAIFDFLESAK